MRKIIVLCALALVVSARPRDNGPGQLGSHSQSGQYGGQGQRGSGQSSQHNGHGQNLGVDGHGQRGYGNQNNKNHGATRYGRSSGSDTHSVDVDLGITQAHVGLEKNGKLEDLGHGNSAPNLQANVGPLHGQIGLRSHEQTGYGQSGNVDNGQTTENGQYGRGGYGQNGNLEYGQTVEQSQIGQTTGHGQPGPGGYGQTRPGGYHGVKGGRRHHSRNQIGQNSQNGQFSGQNGDYRYPGASQSGNLDYGYDQDVYRQSGQFSGNGQIGQNRNFEHGQGYNGYGQSGQLSGNSQYGAQGLRGAGQRGNQGYGGYAPQNGQQTGPQSQYGPKNGNIEDFEGQSQNSGFGQTPNRNGGYGSPSGQLSSQGGYGPKSGNLEQENYDQQSHYRR